MKVTRTGVAAMALLCALVWVGINVVFNYRGHVSGLFWTGAIAGVPSELESGHTYRVADPIGYDGQYYHMLAHDPLNRRGFVSYLDHPRLRGRRIGVPGLAALISAGSDGLVDFAYVGIELAFVFTGAFWLGAYAERHGASAVWGLTFLLVPAVAVSLDRMTIDLPLAALTIGLMLYAEDGARRPVYAILAAAPVVRETGMLLVAGWCVYSALQRRWREAIQGAACAAPAVAWWVYVYSQTAPDRAELVGTYPFSGIIGRTLQGITDPTSTLWLKAAAGFEELGLAAMWLALLLAGYLVWKRRFGLIEVAVMVFAVAASGLGNLENWATVYATARSMSPLLIMLGLIALRERRVVFALPLLMMVPRISLQYEAQIRNAVRGMLS